MSVRVTFVVFSDRTVPTRPIHQHVIYGSGRVWLTRGTCFVARRLEVIAVAQLLWISWCTLSAGKVVLCTRVRMQTVRRRAGLGWRGAAALRLDRKV